MATLLVLHLGNEGCWDDDDDDDDDGGGGDDDSELFQIIPAFPTKHQ